MSDSRQIRLFSHYTSMLTNRIFSHANKTLTLHLQKPCHSEILHSECSLYFEFQLDRMEIHLFNCISPGSLDNPINLIGAGHLFFKICKSLLT